MKTYINAANYCPFCDKLMEIIIDKETGGQHQTCLNTDCSNYSVAFKVPKMEIEYLHEKE